MVEINWTINALEDVHNIAEFIALDSEHYASLVVESFSHVFKFLNKIPKLENLYPN